jgi:outer membrane protein insertion porin family
MVVLFPHFSSRIIYFVSLLALLSSCNVSKYLAPDQHLVVKNSIKIADKSNPINKFELSTELGGQYRQQANKRNIFGFSSEIWLHFKLINRQDKFLYRQFAAPPVIYSDDESQRTALNIRNFMRQKGYLDANCTYHVSFKHKKAKVKYILDLGQIFAISDLTFTTQDTVLKPILANIAQGTVLKIGKPLSGDLFNTEKARIATFLKNDGFAYFVTNNVEMFGDTSENHKVKVRVDLLPPSDSSFHRRVQIGQAIIHTNVVPGQEQVQQDTIVQRLRFLSPSQRARVKPHILANAIELRPGVVYRQEDFDKTYRQLSNLGLYRLVTIKQLKDSSDTEKLNVEILLSPNKRLSVSGDAGLTYTSAQISQLLGGSVNGYMRYRNLFRGAENLQLNMRYGVDFDVTNKANLIFSQELRGIATLSVPRFLDYVGLWRRANKLRIGGRGLVTDKLYMRMKEEGQALFSLSFNKTQFTDLFTNLGGNLAFGYSLKGQKRKTDYRWNHVGIDYLKVNTAPDFEQQLRSNPALRLSLGDQLFTGFLFRDFTYLFQTRNLNAKNTWNFKLVSELSGAEIYLANRLWNIPYPGVSFRLKNLDFASYARIDADLANHHILNRTAGVSLDSRLGGSIAAPYGPSKFVPYVKQVFVGGPNSLRAWRIRELAPGSYEDPRADSIRQNYHTGDIRLEANTELRFDMFWFLKGAVFLDAGNVWTLQKDTLRQGVAFSPNFYKEIAVGTGFGFRADFTYFIVRLDTGLKLRNPFPDKNGSYLARTRIRKFSELSKLNYNIAVGYPF